MRSTFPFARGALVAIWRWPWWASIPAVLVAGLVAIPVGYALTVFEEVPY